MERRAWKHDLVARVERGLQAAPVPVPPPADWAGITSQDEYRRVVARGVLRDDETTFVQAVTERGAGFWAMTPLARADGTSVLVNQGFVPPDRRDPRDWRPHGDDAVPVTGLLRLSQPGGAFLRANDPAADRWHSRDVAAIAAARHLGATAPFFIDAERAPGDEVYPVAGLTIVQFADNHLVYALTWFALALLSAGGAVVVVRDLARDTGRDKARDLGRAR